MNSSTSHSVAIKHHSIVSFSLKKLLFDSVYILRTVQSVFCILRQVVLCCSAFPFPHKRNITLVTALRSRCTSTLAVSRRASAVAYLLILCDVLLITYPTVRSGFICLLLARDCRHGRGGHRHAFRAGICAREGPTTLASLSSSVACVLLSGLMLLLLLVCFVLRINAGDCVFVTIIGRASTRARAAPEMSLLVASREAHAHVNTEHVRNISASPQTHKGRFSVHCGFTVCCMRTGLDTQLIDAIDWNRNSIDSGFGSYTEMFI